MKEIALTQGQVALVNDKDFEFLNQFKWCAWKHRNTFYAARRLPTTNGKQRHSRMHHEIIGKPPKGFETDHQNGCGTDNQRKNLRFVTCRQNQQNRKHQNSSSQYPGVCWDKSRKKWVAHITINNELKYLGRFTNEEKAFLAYKQAVNELGESIIEGAKI